MMKTVESTELSFLCGLVKDKWALQGLMHGQSSPMCPTHTGRQTDILGMSVLCGIKICGPHKHQKYAAEVCGNMVQNCLKPTTTSRSTAVRMVPFCWQPDGRDNEA